MATCWITEFNGFAANNPIPSRPLASQPVTVTSSASTAALTNAATNMITLQSDVPVFLTIGSSGSTGVITSTFGGAIRIPANAPPFPIAVAPYSRLTIIST